MVKLHIEKTLNITNIAMEFLKLLFHKLAFYIIHLYNMYIHNDTDLDYK